MATRHNRIEFMLNANKTVTIKMTRRGDWQADEKRQFTVTQREFERALRDGRIAIPWTVRS